MKTPTRKTPKRKTPKRPTQSKDPLLDAAKAAGDKQLIVKLQQLKKKDPADYKKRSVKALCVVKCGKTHKEFSSLIRCMVKCAK